MPTLRVMVKDTAADADAFSGTDLELIPGPGLLEVYTASTVNTATCTAVVGQDNLLRDNAVSLRTNGVPNVDQDDPLFVYESETGGEKVVINLGGTTGTIFTVGLFTPEDDL
jgi:hypothetical protein